MIRGILFGLTICIACAISVHSQSTFDRAAAIAKIDQRLAADESWQKQYLPLSRRNRAGENVGQTLEALKATRPQFADLKETALAVIESDATDEAAFRAIQVILRGQRETKERALQTQMSVLLLKHHLQRPEFIDASYLSFETPKNEIKFWNEVLEGSPHRSVRAYAAFRLVKQNVRLTTADNLDSSERMAARHQAKHFAQMLRQDYGDVASYANTAQILLASLSYGVGVALPDMEVVTVNGAPDRLSHYRGKVVLLDFWATWCRPCRKSHPELIALKAELAAQPFEIIGISADKNPEVVTRYMAEELSLPWPQWFTGPDHPLLKAWGVQGYPTYLLVNADGVVLARGEGNDLSAIKDKTRAAVKARN